MDLATMLFGSTYKEKCPDGTSRRIYRDIDVAFPLYIKGFEANLSAKGEAETVGAVKVDAAYSNRIDGLLFALDELNQGLMVTFRGAYLAFSANPCGSGDYLKREVSKILDEQRRLRLIKMQLDALTLVAQTQPIDSDEFAKQISEIVQKIGTYPGHEVTQDELEKASETAKLLAASGRGGSAVNDE